MGNENWHLDMDWDTDRQTARIDRTIVRGIILGARMEDDDRDELIGFCRYYRPDIWIEVARTADDEFKLEFERI